MPTSREFPIETMDMGQYRARPMSPIEALMSCAPGEEPDTSQMEMLGLREALADAFDALTPEESWLFNALHVEKRSLRDVARMTGIPKTTLSRIRDLVQQKLQDHLSTHPLVQEHLHR